MSQRLLSHPFSFENRVDVEMTTQVSLERILKQTSLVRRPSVTLFGWSQNTSVLVRNVIIVRVHFSSHPRKDI